MYSRLNHDVTNSAMNLESQKKFEALFGVKYTDDTFDINKIRKSQFYYFLECNLIAGLAQYYHGSQINDTLIYHGAVFLTDTLVAVLNNLPGSTLTSHGNSKLEFILEYTAVSSYNGHRLVKNKPLCFLDKEKKPVGVPEDQR